MAALSGEVTEAGDGAGGVQEHDGGPPRQPRQKQSPVGQPHALRGGKPNKAIAQRVEAHAQSRHQPAQNNE